MIDISLSAFFTIIICLAVCINLFLWFRQLWKSISQNWELSEPQVIHCASCQYAMYARAQERVKECPSCKTEFRTKVKQSAKRQLKY